MTYLIIINYNSSKDTIECLSSLENVETDCKIIIIDNYSLPDDLLHLELYLKKKNVFNPLGSSDFNIDFQSKISLVYEIRNLGFAAGNNHGIKIAQKQDDFEGVVLLNNDTIVDPFFLNEILSFRRQNINADLIGGRIFFENKNDVIWYDGGRFNKHIMRAIHINENKKISKISTKSVPQKTEFITGCLMYISKKCIDKIGLLDDSLFMYHEDLDYCIRATKNGLSLYYVPSAIIWHKVGGSSGGKLSYFSVYWLARNRIKVARKHSNAIDKIFTYAVYIISRIPRFLVWSVKGRSDIISAQIKGFIDGCRK